MYMRTGMGDSDLHDHGMEERTRFSDADHHPPPAVQWPEEGDLPGFKTTFLRYLKAVENLSNEFIELVAEALGLPSDGVARFTGLAIAFNIAQRCVYALVPPVLFDALSVSPSPRSNLIERS